MAGVPSARSGPGQGSGRTHPAHISGHLPRVWEGTLSQTSPLASPGKLVSVAWGHHFIVTKISIPAFHFYTKEREKETSLKREKLAVFGQRLPEAGKVPLTQHTRSHVAETLQHVGCKSPLLSGARLSWLDVTLAHANEQRHYTL